MKPVDLLLALTVAIVWGLGFPFAKAGLGQLPPIFLMGLRFTLAALVLIWFVRPPWGYLGRIFGIVVIGGTIPYSLIFSGLGQLDASTAVLVVQLQVPFMAVFGWLMLGEQFGWRRLFGMVLAFVGVALIAGQPALGSSLVPLFMVISGGTCWAFGQALIRRLAPRLGGLQLIAWVAALVSPQLFIASYLFERGQIDGLLAADLQGWTVILYLGLVMTAFGYALWYRLLARCEVNQVGPFLLLQPVVAVVASVLFLSESPTLPTLVGGVIVIAGVAIITIRPKQAG